MSRFFFLFVHTHLACFTVGPQNLSVNIKMNSDKLCPKWHTYMQYTLVKYTYCGYTNFDMVTAVPLFCAY